MKLERISFSSSANIPSCPYFIPIIIFYPSICSSLPISAASKRSVTFGKRLENHQIFSRPATHSSPPGWAGVENERSIADFFHDNLQEGVHVLCMQIHLHAGVRLCKM